ncbi:MAG TPA: tail fiber domain-containing protein [Bacteroidia bacterium]|jgi:hypothetical protein|nr:tail fiber domain-containing protein [Bacteroidia bacterium]
MKTKFILNFAALTMTISSYSQIKIFSGGSVTIGAITSPTSNAVTHQIIGSKVVFPASTSAVTSAPLIVGQNAVSSSPGFAFLGDYQTGIAHPASSVLAITIANSEKFRFNSSGQILNSNSSSSPSTPDYSWNSDPNTGMYRPLSHYLSLCTNGLDRFVIAANGQLQSYNAAGTAANPDYSWGTNNNTGIFNPGSNVIGFSTGGTERMRVTSSGNLLVGSTTDNGNRVQITGSSNQSALLNTTSQTSDYGYCQINQVNRSLTKAYSVYSSATGTNTENFFVNGSGDAWGKSWTSWSDKTLKENIDSLPNALNLVKQLKGVKYNFKSSVVGPGPIKTEIGLIAQDVESIVPEVVNTSDKGIKGIMYQNLVPLLIESIKAHDKQITQLQSDVNNCCIKTAPQSNRIINNTTTTINNSEEYKGGSYIKQNTPNPFNKETNIEYFIAEKNSESSILVFDMNGKLLKTFKLNNIGSGTLTISANDFQPGMYYYSLIVNAKEVGTKKMILTD